METVREQSEILPQEHLPRRPASRRGFEIAIICALTLEADAVEALFDHHWDDPPYVKAVGDSNAYSTGAIGRHAVVLAHMPGMGKANAAVVAANCRLSFPNIKLAIVVGICGVVPISPAGEIVLGDVIVSETVIQYDFGRRFPERFVPKDTLLDSLGRPNVEIRALLNKLKGRRAQKKMQEKTVHYLTRIQSEEALGAEYPGATYDKLFEASYRHVSDGKSCDEAGCNGPLVARRRLQQGNPQPVVRIGSIASGDTVMKSGEDRDAIAGEQRIIAFEMESAGAWDTFPCVVIKGACDYADSHKAKGWQQYAAATAAACMKAFLDYWAPSQSTDLVPLLPRQSRRPFQYLPFVQNRRFVGREKTLQKLRDLLFVQENQRVALFGLGGIGKTQVALELAYWMKENKPDHSIFWVPALSEATFEKAYVDIAQKVGIRRSDDHDMKESVRQYLDSEAAGRWLLVIDNADDAKTVSGSAGALCGGIDSYLPTSAMGKILFTTRSHDVALSVVDHEAAVELEEMDPLEARRLLERSLLRKDLTRDDTSVTELLSELTHLPLAITQAAAYLERNKISLREYLMLLRNTETDMVDLLTSELPDRTRYPGSQNAVATTWIVSFRQIRECDSIAAELLAFLSQIEPKAIPQSLLPELGSRAQTVSAIGTLCVYAFVYKREDGMLDMHSLVHLATQVWVRNEGLAEKTAEEAVRHMAEIFPSDDYTNRDTWRAYFPHAFRILRATGSIDMDERYELFFWVGRCLQEDGRIKEAVHSLAECCRWREGHLPEDHPDRLGSQHNLAGAYQANGQVKEAVTLLEQVVAIREKTLKEDHPHRLASQHNLAGAYTVNGQVKEAVTLLEQVVAIQEKTLKEDHPHRLASQHNLAGAYQANGQVKEAVTLLEQVVAIQEKTLKEDHPHQLASQHELAGAYKANGQVKEAVTLLEQVVAIQEKTLKEDHPSRLASQHELAGAYKANGQVKEAVTLLEQVVAIEEKTLKEDHPSRLASQHNLAVFYELDGQVQKARALLENVVEVEARTLPERHPDRLLSQQTLAHITKRLR